MSPLDFLAPNFGHLLDEDEDDDDDDDDDDDESDDEDIDDTENAWVAAHWWDLGGRVVPSTVLLSEEDRCATTNAVS